jgi:predicted dehydrogenase
MVQEQPDACITCVWDEDPVRGAEWAQELGVDFVADYDALLAEDIDTVYVALPNDLHYAYTKKALEAGKDVIMEKPATSNLAELQSLVSLAEKARFSQHTMTEEEFGILAQAAHDHTDELKQATPFFRKLWHKYGLCLY